jgi:sortase A
VLRFVASVLITSGLLMLVDAGLSVAWQEPVSAFMASREQDKLASRLNKLDAAAAADLRSVGSPGTDRRALARLARLQRRRTHTGDPIGRIVMPTLKRRTVVVQGTDTSSLRKGPGHYPKTSFPGEGGTVAVAGHRTTYGAPFNRVDELRAGDAIVLETRDTWFTYRVTSEQVVKPTAVEVTYAVPGNRTAIPTKRLLTLTTCNPKYSAKQRLIVHAVLERALLKADGDPPALTGGG